MIVPFFISHSGCPHQCVFCNQKNITGQKESADASSIPRKIREHLNTNSSNEPVQVAFYGGSFTALPMETQKAYLEAARPFITSGRIENIRLSTRPDALDGDILTFLKAHHVKTIELGVQSMDDRVLTLSGRGHTAADTVNAVRLLKEYNFIIGLQLMPGLPGDSIDGFIEKTVKTVIELKPAFVRIYPLLVIKDTPLEELYKIGAYVPLSIDEAVAVCKEAVSRFEQTDIRVIRIGLQPTKELERPGAVLAGPYHPAFRQLVESSILLDAMRKVLATIDENNDPVVIVVNPEDISSAVGQKRSNIKTLKKEFTLKSLRFLPDPRAPKGTVSVSGRRPDISE